MTSRAKDEAMLAMLVARKNRNSEDIANEYGLTSSAVRVATNRVVADDSAAEGRDVIAEYGWLDRNEATRMGVSR